MIIKTVVKSFYNNLFVNCYECDGIKYVANQHGDWDVYEGAYERGEKTRVVKKNSEEINKILNEYKKQGGS